MRRINPRTLAGEYLAITEEMGELKEKHRARRVDMEREHAAELRAMRVAERELSARRAQVALRMTQTGHRLEDLGQMVGVSAAFICQLARSARKEHGDTPPP